MTTVQMSELPMNAISSLLNDNSALVKTDVARLIKGITYIVKTYYGLDPDTGKYDDVIEMSSQKILIKFPTLTFFQLSQCYFLTDIDKRQGTSLTVTELIAPLAEFVKKANFIKKAEQEIIDAEKDSHEVFNKIKSSYLTARELYFGSMDIGSYKGGMHQAAMIVENFKDLLDNQTKVELLEKSKLEYYKAVEESKASNPDHIKMVPTGTGYYENGKPKPACHYFLCMNIINYFLAKKTPDGKGWKFVEA